MTTTPNTPGDHEFNFEVVEPLPRKRSPRSPRPKKVLDAAQVETANKIIEDLSYLKVNQGVSVWISAGADNHVPPTEKTRYVRNRGIENFSTVLKKIVADAGLDFSISVSPVSFRDGKDLHYNDDRSKAKVQFTRKPKDFRKPKAKAA